MLIRRMWPQAWPDHQPDFLGHMGIAVIFFKEHGGVTFSCQHPCCVNTWKGSFSDEQWEWTIRNQICNGHIPESYWLCLELDLDLVQNNDLVIFCNGIKPLALPSTFPYCGLQLEKGIKKNPWHYSNGVRDVQWRPSLVSYILKIKLPHTFCHFFTGTVQT